MGTKKEGRELSGDSRLPKFQKFSSTTQHINTSPHHRITEHRTPKTVNQSDSQQIICRVTKFSLVGCLESGASIVVSCPVFNSRRDLPRYQGDIIINPSIMDEISFVISQAPVEGNSSSVNFSSHTRRV